MSLLLVGAGPQVDFVAPTGVPAFLNLLIDGGTPMDQTLRFSTGGSIGNAYHFVMVTTVGTPSVNDTASALTWSYKDGISTVGDLEAFLPTAHVSVVSSSQNPSADLSGFGTINLTFHGGHS